jgi:hypothetical protein
MEGGKKSISSGGWKLLYASAVIVDGVQIIIGIVLPIAGEIVNVVVNFIYGGLLAMYLHRKGVSMVKWQNLTRFLVSFGVDEASLGFVPAWTINIALTHRSVKAEEKRNKPSQPTVHLNQDGVRRPSGNSQPLNVEGIRPPSNL